MKKEIKEFWNWLWKSESIWSYLVFLLFIFIIVKFIFLPGLGLLFGSQLPLAIVESSSMEHYALKECISYNSNLECTAQSDYYAICGKQLDKFQYLNSNRYWENCGDWYAKINITQEQFSNFKFRNGFRKGDIMVIIGKKNIQVGDVIVFNAGRSTPIIHRVISLEPLETKGDHNPTQLSKQNNYYQTDETNIPKDKVIGVAVARIPYLGWIKIFFVELLKKLF